MDILYFTSIIWAYNISLIIMLVPIRNKIFTKWLPFIFQDMNKFVSIIKVNKGLSKNVNIFTSVQTVR